METSEAKIMQTKQTMCLSWKLEKHGNKMKELQSTCLK